MADAAQILAIEYLQTVYDNKPAEPYTNAWLSAVPDDKGKEAGQATDHRKIESLDDIREFVSEWNGRRNVYYKGARYQENAEGTRIVDAQVFCFAWVDIDIADKPGIPTQAQIDMVCDALDSFYFQPSVIVYSGGGIQALWHFSNPIVLGVDPKAHAIIEGINRNLARVFGGDSAPAHPAGGLRLPGTRNMNRQRPDGSVIAKVLRLEPDKLCAWNTLEPALRKQGAKLFKDKNGAWHTLSGEMSDAARVHAAEASKAHVNADGKAAKTPDEWDDIILGMVRKGGRNVSMAKYAGKLMRSGMSEEDALANITDKIKEAVQRVRAAGEQAHPPGKSEIASVIRSVAKTESRHKGEVDSYKAAVAAQKPEAKKRTRKAAAPNPVDPNDGQAGRGEADETERPEPDTPRMPRRSDPGGFFDARSDTASDRAHDAADTNTETYVNPANTGDPRTFDPRDPAHELRRIVRDWYDQKDSKGVHVNAGKEFPYPGASLVKLVIKAFIRTLEKNDIGLVRHRDEWWMYDDNAKTWDPVSDERVIGLFTEFWEALTGLAATYKRAREFVDTMSVTPGIVDNAVVWNTPIARGIHATLFACGTLVLIDAKGKLTTRPALRTDMLTTSECPRVAAKWTPGAKCERILNALEQMALFMPDAAARSDWVEAVLAWACQIFLPAPRPKRLYRAAVFFGDSDTGKSFILDIPRTVLEGPGMPTRVCVTPVSELGKDFSLMPMLGKRAWLVGEAKSTGEFTSDDLLKQLITDEAMDVRVKFKDNINTRLHLTIGVATNVLPRFSDISAGTLSRVLYFPLRMRFMPLSTYNRNDPYQLPAITDIADILEAERNGVAQVLVDRAQKMLASGRMPIPQSMVDETGELYGSSNWVITFINQAIEAKPTRDSFVTNADLKTAFRGMVCDQDGWAAASKLDTRMIENNLFTALRHKYHAERSQGNKAGKPMPVHRRVWLSPSGLDWYRYGLKHDSGQRDKPLTDYNTLADVVNRPLPGTVPQPPTTPPPPPSASVTNIEEARAARDAAQ